MSDQVEVSVDEAYFAEVKDGLVVRVLVIPSSERDRGAEYLAVDLGLGGEWVETFSDGSARGRYASVGFTYFPQHDVFAGPQPFPSWVLDTQSGEWNAPVPHPGGGYHYWDEESLSWIPSDPPVFTDGVE